MACRARQFNDQMVCHTCGLVWDATDPERPACNMDRNGKLTGAAVDKRLSALQAILAGGKQVGFAGAAARRAVMVGQHHERDGIHQPQDAPDHDVR